MKAYIALAFICIVWGTTYLAMRIGIAQFPPFLFSGIRQSTAGLLLLMMVLLSGVRYRWTAGNVARQAVTGFLMITLGNGLVSWAIQHIPSGLAALIGAVTPACTVLIDQVVSRQFRLPGLVVLGLLLGLVGMGFVFADNLADLANPAYLWGVVLTLLATLSWALGTVYSKNFGKQNNSFVNAALQLGFGGLGQLIWSAGTEQWSQVAMPSAQVIGALAYLVVFGSILAFVSYLYVLQTLPIGLASVYCYVNPLVAVLLGWLVLDERLTPITGFAFAFVAAGVYFINEGYKKSDK